MPDIVTEKAPTAAPARWWQRSKIVTVFAASPLDAAAAVIYLRRELPDLPICLFTQEPPAAEIALQCEQVIVRNNASDLLREAWRLMQSRWIALGVTAWTNRSGPWLLNVAPFFTPPFHTLVMNESAGFFPPSPKMVLRHAVQRVRGAKIWPAISAFVEERWFYTRVWFWRKGIGLRDFSRYYWRWWPVLLRDRWEPVRVYLIYRAGHKVLDVGLSTMQRLQDLYWAIADPFEKRAFALHRLLLGLWRFCWARPMARWLAGQYPETQRRFAEYASAVSPPVHTTARSLLHDQSDIAVFPYAAKLWSRPLLIRLASRSSSRFLMLVRGQATAGDFSGIAPLFRDPDTFAVSYQSETRSWDRSLFCRAPFRRLQPGEVSPVLAPIADVIWVDRTKLEALGVPFAWFPQSALLILFWQAAAAGWRSYQVGGPAAISGEPPPAVRWPAEETEAAQRLIRSRASVPDTRIAWGNIAFHPASVTPTPASRRERPLRVLIVSPYLPFPLSHGGAVRIYNLCKALAPRVEFLLATFREKTDEVRYDKLHEIFREVFVVDRDEPLSPDESLPAQVRGQQSRSMEALVEELCRTRHPDLVQIEYTHLAPLRAHTNGIPSILVEHDITFSLYRQLAEQTPTPAAQAEFERWRKFEQYWLQQYEIIWTMSSADRALALREGGAPVDRVCVVPNGVDITRFQPADTESDAPEVFFVGSFRHYPNIIGFERLRHEIMPAVWAEFPQTRLRVIAGPDPGHYWREFKKEPYPELFDERIILHGFVEDLRPLYAQASVVAIPLLVSAGTNIKLMEAMACGRAVVSTVVGCAGLDLQDGHDLLIRDTSSGFAEGIRRLLAAREFRRRLERQARRTAEERFSWTSIADAAHASYQQLVEEAHGIQTRA